RLPVSVRRFSLAPSPRLVAIPYSSSLSFPIWPPVETSRLGDISNVAAWGHYQSRATGFLASRISGDEYCDDAAERTLNCALKFHGSRRIRRAFTMKAAIFSCNVRYLYSWLCAVALAGLAYSAEKPRAIPIGLDAYRSWDHWADQRIGMRAYMRSTYDRGGGNEGADAAHFLYQLSDEFNVTLDLEGPGMLVFSRYN